MKDKFIESAHMLEIQNILPSVDISSKYINCQILYFAITKQLNSLKGQNQNARLISISNFKNIHFKAKVIRIEVEPQAAHISNCS